jgi:lipoprotein-releasing system ATP-binding protein
MIRAENLKKNYGPLAVLKGIDLHVHEGEIVSVVGASGAGKSTLLHILGTLDKADEGSLFINGKPLSGLSSGKMAEFRNRQIGFVFQFHHLLPEFTALENICIPAFIAGLSEKEAKNKARALLEVMNLSGREDHKPSQLSGGEQQRVAVARALINEPPVILADEPSGNLDSASAVELHKLFFTLRDRFRRTFVIVTHNTDLADMADRKLTMRDGRIESTVKP